MLTKRGHVFPLVILLIGIFATIVASTIVSRVERDRRRARLGGLADRVAAAIEGRLNEQQVLLRGLAALFQASGEVTRREFDAYTARMRLSEDHPGVLGVGYAVSLDNKSELDAITRTLQREVPGFKPWAMADKFPASIILHLNPPSKVNRRALGFDMFAEPVRREAMRRALTTGRASMTGKVTLVQDEGSGNHAGFLLYVPVGKITGARPGTAAYNASGWAYSPLRARELFAAILARPGLDDAATQVFDGPVTPENLLFRSFGFPDKNSLQVQRLVEFGGRRWTVVVSASPAFFASGPLQLTWIVVLGGAMISLLLTVLAAQQSRSMQQTAREVERSTTELRLANEALTSAAHAREEAEAQVRQMQKIEAIGQLTGGIAHDFNNMLAVVIGNLDLAERRIDQAAKVARAIAAARQGALRAADLTQRLLAFGRKQALKPRPLDPNRLIDGMSELLRRTLGEQLNLRTALTSDIWLVGADPGQLENAVLNLAINSRDAMASGGTLVIETHNCNLDERYEELHEGVRAGQYVLIEVIDSGAGMPSAVLERALDPFFTTKEVGKGTGLGLSQVFGFVKQSGGHLNIASRVGEGTTVKIYLPRLCGSLLSMPEGTDSSRDSSALTRGQADELILVVEDEEEVRLATVETLRDLGYTVVHAATGVDALNVLDRHGGAALLFTDVVMPGMNGRELAEEACSRYPDLRVLFTTGYTPDAIVHEGRLDLDVSLVPKPFTTVQLAKKVRALLDR